MTDPAVLAGVLSPESHLSAQQPKRTSVPATQPVELIQVRTLYRDSVAARADFINAVWRAHDAGHSNLKIASFVGMTEAGIRMLLKRHPRG